MNFYRKTIAVIALLSCTATLSAQDVDLENVTDGFQKDQLLKLNGSAALSGIFYQGNNNLNERLPFTYFANGMLNFRIANLIDVPFSFTLTNVGGSFQYPTLPSRLSIHPSYKWAKAHIGNVAMAFSPYTLNGHLFDGAGVDLEPGKWRFSAMFGRLQRAQDFDENNLASPAAYKRMGKGLKLGYVGDRFRVAYSLFHAKDDLTSINILPPDSFNIRPQENIATSLEAGVKIIKGLELSATYANTGLTTITGQEADNTSDVKKGMNAAALFMKTTGSTEFHHAFKTNLNYAFRKTIIGLGYERVDPGYRTLGAYYFTNDMENYTVNLNQILFDNKLTLSAALGLQKDNLNSTKAATNSRTVGVLNVVFMPKETIQILANYSNFRSFTNVQTRFMNINQVNPYQYIDTLDFLQVSQNAMLNTNFILSKTESAIHSLNLSGNFLDAMNKNGNTVDNNSSSKFYNAVATWSTNFVPKKIMLAIGYNYVLNTMAMGNTVIQGPVATMGYILLRDKLTTNLSLAYNMTENPGTTGTVTVFNSRLNARYAFAKQQQLSLNVMGQNRNAAVGNYADWIFTLGYELSF